MTSSMLLASDAPQSTSATIRALQLGLDWFAEGGGGADRMYADLVRALPGCGVRCRGLVAGSERVAVDSAGVVRAFAAVDDSVLKRWRCVRAAIREEFKQHRPDVVVSHFAFYAFPALKLIRRQAMPFVVHFQGPWAGESKAEGAGRLVAGAKATVERRVYRRAQRLIVLSDSFGELLIRNYGIAPQCVRTVPPGVETARFRAGPSRATARQQLGWPTDRPIVMTVRRLTQRMGLENLIDAAAKMRGEVPDLLVMIAGKGPLSEPLQKQIARLGLQQHVRMLGFVPDHDLPKAYAAADLTIVPTVQLEGFGLIVVESLASGTPAFVTPIGGLPEAVRDLSPELILSGSDAEAIARSLTDALRSRISLPSADACRTFATEKYDWSVIGPKIRAVYQEAIAER